MIVTRGAVWQSLLETARHAPSPHNVQPWRVRIVSDTQAELLIEKRRTLPREDATGSFIVSTMGMFIEALTLIAANRSMTLRHEFLKPLSDFSAQRLDQSSDDLLPFARLFIETTGSDPSAYSDAVFLARRTSRMPLHDDPVPARALQAFSDLATAWGQRYVQITDQALIARTLDCNTQALFEDLNDPNYHDEIVDWFRYSDSTARRCRDGLDARCMNAWPPMFWLAAHAPGLLLMPGVRSLMKRVYRRQLGPVPTIGMLAGPFWDPQGAFDTGRFLLRFWLEITRHGLYLHPYGNLVTNRHAADWCREHIGVADVWLAFKIGRSTPPPQSYRRSIEEILVA